MIDRRDFLTGGSLMVGSLAAVSGLSAQPANTRRPPALRPGEWLQIPDFSVLANDPFRTGLRPFRAGGVRLETDRGADIPRGRKVLIHNYGHGGAGITLSWGCADRVKELIAEALRDTLQKQPAAARVVVIGAGAIGLTTAAELKRWAPAISVIVQAENVSSAGTPLPQKTTSWIAGGQFEPSGIWRQYLPDRLHELHDLVRRSHRRILELKRQGRQRQYGVVDRKNYILETEDGRGFERGIPSDVVLPPRQGLLPFQPLATVLGKEYSTWLINPTIMLPKLVADLRAANVRFEQRNVRSRAELISVDADIVVNCTGLGAGEMLNDAVKPIRGQLVVLNNPGQLKYMFSGGCGDEAAYMFARQNDIVIGGTYHDCENVGDLPEESYRAVLRRMQRIFSGDVSECVAGRPTLPPQRCNLTRRVPTGGFAGSS